LPPASSLDHDDFGLNPSKIMNVIESKSLERDAGGKPVSTFPHPALAGARHHHGHHQWPKTAATYRPDIDASDAAAAGRLG
jgi:hypothetical protein